MVSKKRKKMLERELGRVLKIIIKEYRPLKIILFGSLASGVVHEWSDLDLAIISTTAKPFLDRTTEVMLLIRPRIGCDIVVYTPEEYDQMRRNENLFLIDEIDKGGRILYESG